ncbi:hypothetical protein EV694_0565 [Volucribacter psittacicida]|uniref:Ribbon-helix-helix CopG family protein n=1 Tax=Volucribacter psittacicida TaxID=203482 RepID=A0A4R1G2G7_9PAST|nr:hypothetical protein EV694_0565 [Volucribacter psittacicida]
MALSMNEIRARSDEKRGVKAKSYKLPIATIAKIEQLSKQLNIPQNQLIIQAVELFEQKYLISYPLWGGLFFLFSFHFNAH